MKKTLKGRITIGRLMNVPEYMKDREVNITLEDVNSGATFLSIDMSVENFGKAILNQGSIPIHYDIVNLNKLGKKHETKIEDIRIAHSPMNLPDITIKNILKDYEIDGWLADVSGFGNHHNISRPNEKINNEEIWIYKISFHRFVDMENEDA